MPVDVPDSSARNPVEELAEEFALRRRKGEKPTVQEYVDRYPDFAQQIRDLFPTLLVMERIGEEPAPEVGDKTLDVKLALEQIGDFRIVRELGRGGMGIVFEAEQESLARRVALKVMLPRAQLDPRHRIRFEREARAAARLHHSNIVPVYGVGQQDGLHYFVMQLIDGHGLDEVLRDLRRLRGIGDDHAMTVRPLSAATQHLLSPHERQEDRSVSGRNGLTGDGSGAVQRGSGVSSHSESGLQYYRKIAALGIQAAEALEYANSQDVLHRDVKPSNLLLDSEGTLWVTDFGLAKEADADDLTMTGDLIGTLRFMAPERFRNECTERSDIYGLGLTLYELLTMEPAFKDADRPTLVARVLNECPVPPRSIAPGIPRDLETIVLKSISIEPAGRYGSAGELASDLRRFLEDRPIHARRISVSERLWRTCRRNPTVATLVASIAVLLALAAVVGMLGYRETLAALQEATAARHAERVARRRAQLRATEAEAANERAERARAEAAAAVETYFTNVSENRLLQEPGLQPLRRELLEAALHYYERLITMQSNDTELHNEAAISHVRAAALHALVGANSTAVERYQSGIRLLTPISNGERNDERYSIWLMRARRGLANQFAQREDWATALLHLSAGVEVGKQSDSQYHSVSKAIEYVKLLLDRSAVFGHRSNFRESVGDANAAVALLDTFVDMSPELLAALAEAHERVGDANSNPDFGQFAESFTPYENAVRFRRELLSLNQQDLTQRDKLVASLRKLSRAHFSHQNVTHSLTLLQQALKEARELHRENPNVVGFHRSVIRTNERLALCYGRIEETENAVAHLEQAVALQSELARRFGNREPFLRQLGRLQFSLAVQLDHAGRSVESKQVLIDAVNSTKQSVERATEPLTEIRLHGELSATYALNNDFESARRHSKQAIERACKLLEDGGDSVEVRIVLGRLFSDFGSLQGKRHDFTAAAEAFADSIEHFQQVLDSDAQHRRARHGLYLSYFGRGTACYFAGELETSVTSWQAASQLAPAEYSSFTARWLGFVCARNGDYRRAASAAEQLQRGDAARFYYNAPHAAALCKYQAAQVFAMCSKAALTNVEPATSDLTKMAEHYLERSLQLIEDAAIEGLFEDAAQRASLDTFSTLDPLRESQVFNALIDRLPDTQDGAMPPEELPGSYWPPVHFGMAPK